MRVSVTGAAGFLGRHIARRFRAEGWNVVGIDLEPFDEDGIESRVGDFTDEANAIELLEHSDVVAHVGAIGDVYLAGRKPSLAAKVNVVGTSNIALAAERHGSRVVYASTWEVYGSPEYEPIDEAHPTRPDHPYNITKLAGESLLLAACKLNGISAVALRLGTAYGPGLRQNSVFRIFIDRARDGMPITIQGDGSQARQFTHASDIARAFVLAAGSSESGIALNIVDPRLTTIKELAELVTQRIPTDLTFGDPRPGDVPSSYVSAESARTTLGWTPEIDFVDGLTEIIETS